MVLLLRIEDNRVWRPGLKKIGNLEVLPFEAKELFMGEFAKFIAAEYSRLLVQAIDTQKFKSTWKPLTKKYLAFKKEMGWSEKIWEATSLLKDSIGVWRVYKPVNAFAVGIKRNVYYTTETGKRIRVLDVAKWMEYGTGDQAEDGKGKAGFPGMSPRPLFRPVRTLISKGISRFWKVFVMENVEVIDEILAMYLVGNLVTTK